ncbi:MAG: succinate dehydrogenase, cytochrome b556 subunit [Oxalobacteraceae bacterium]|jgi:succinate dehydrogenase / fumarate reductase cytochrome b subunit|nr:succinate dehydrogenase, cytochrome b556 subunit [Oxalobacteraceae bacterium]
MSEPSTPRRFTNIHILQIIRYRLPLAGMVSILHRISGAMMFLLLPFILYLFDLSITSEISFDRLQGFASHWFVKLLILAVSWGYLHHFCGGIRHLIMDAHIGLTKEGARASARMVFVVSLLLTLLVAFKLFGAR